MLDSYVKRTVEGQSWIFHCHNTLQQLFVEKADEETLRKLLHDGKNHLVI